MESSVPKLEATQQAYADINKGPTFAVGPANGVFTTFVTSLGHPEVSLKKAIPVTILPDGDEFTASFMDANISSGGGSPQEALYNLQQLIADFFLMDEDEPTAVSRRMAHQRRVLAECVCRISPKTTPAK